MENGKWKCVCVPHLPFSIYHLPFLSNRSPAMQTPRWAFAAVVVLGLMIPRAALAAKTYQVTGPVLEVNDKMIVVEKNKERWEIERNADTKVEGELKVGQKVT